MVADLLDGERIAGIIPADIVLDQKNRGIFRNMVADACKKLLSSGDQQLVKLLVSKTAFQMVNDTFLCTCLLYTSPSPRD